MSEQKWDRNWLELMYNNRARVPESGAYIEKWTELSEKTRNSLEGRAFLNIAYGPSGEETLDIFMPKLPENGKKPPVFFFIHGGYWHALHKDNFSFIAKTLSEKGACVVVVNYTLCPHVKVSGIVDEITRALIWTKRHIGEYGADAEQITVAGHSAGGHLTAMMFTHDWQILLPELHNAHPFKNGLSLSGLFDLAPLQYTPFLEILQLDDNDLTHSNPIRLPCLTDQAYLYSIVGGNESEAFIHQNTLIQSHWGSQIVPICMTVQELDHFTIVEALIDGEHQVHSLVLELLGL